MGEGGGQGAMRKSGKIILMTIASSGAIALSLGSSHADPGGFALRQSPYFQGTSMAGVAAGGASISSMFWNPATITQAGRGLTVEGDGTLDMPHADITPLLATSPTGVNLTPLGSSGDIFDKATLIPSAYAVYGLNNGLSFGLGLNSPFGLKTQPNALWSGMFYSQESNIKAIDATPTVAWKINNWLSVGAAAQIQYFRVRLDSAFPGSGLTGPFPFLAPLGPDELSLRGDSWGYGYTLGATLTPTSWTTIGVGYRSGLDQKTSGNIFRPSFVAPVVVPPFGLVPVAVPGTTVGFNATVPLPGAVTASIRQKITDSFTLLGTVEWTNWSRLNTVPVATPVLGLIPGIPTQLSFGWRDGWMYSAGLEYMCSRYLALRTGIGWEQSPITDATRSTRLPDADRLWVSGGATYKWNEQFSLDFAYTHIFVRDASINISPGSANPVFDPRLGTFIGTSSAAVDIVSVGLRYHFVPVGPRVVVRKG
jgi:long-chain fatty acid transport protein